MAIGAVLVIGAIVVVADLIVSIIGRSKGKRDVIGRDYVVEKLDVGG